MDLNQNFCRSETRRGNPAASGTPPRSDPRPRRRPGDRNRAAFPRTTASLARQRHGPERARHAAATARTNGRPRVRGSPGATYARPLVAAARSHHSAPRRPPLRTRALMCRTSARERTSLPRRPPISRFGLFLNPGCHLLVASTGGDEIPELIRRYAGEFKKQIVEDSNRCLTRTHN